MSLDLAISCAMKARSDAIEECAKVAEATRVSANGHPQIDAPTPGDMQRAIARAIRALGQAVPDPSLQKPQRT